jgi:RNA recognition motif-containing protein
VEIPKNRSSGRNRGFALVVMKDQQGADEVVKNLNSTVFKDFKIKINIVNE